MLPVFADPKTDFVFKRLFGEEAHKELLIALLNALLELPEGHRITRIFFLSQENRPAVPELKLSIIDVRCHDEAGSVFVVEMQVLNVEAFEKRVVYNVSKTYVMQLRSAERYPALNDVIGVTICDFVIWPWKGSEISEGEVPMLSRWRMQEQHGGAKGLGQIQFVFLELPKYRGAEHPETIVEKWAYFFREAENLTIVPESLKGQPFQGALEVSRTANFTPEEWDAYDRAKMAEQDARGAASLAERIGEERGFLRGEKAGEERGFRRGEEAGEQRGVEKGLRKAIRSLCAILGIELDDERSRVLEAESEKALLARMERLQETKNWK